MANKGIFKELVKDNASAITALSGYLVVDLFSDGLKEIAAGHAIFKYDETDKAIYKVTRELVSEKNLDPAGNPVVLADPKGDLVYSLVNKNKYPIDGEANRAVPVENGDVELEIALGFLAHIEGALNWGEYVSFQASEAYVIDSLDDLGPEVPVTTTTTTTTKAPETTTTTTTSTTAAAK